MMLMSYDCKLPPYRDIVFPIWNVFECMSEWVECVWRAMYPRRPRRVAYGWPPVG